MRIDYLKARIKCTCHADVFILVQDDMSVAPVFVNMPAVCEGCGRKFFMHIQEQEK